MSKITPLQLQAAKEFLDANAGDMPEDWWEVAAQLLAEYRSAAFEEAAQLCESQAPDVHPDTDDEYRRGQKRVALDCAKPYEDPEDVIARMCEALAFYAKANDADLWFDGGAKARKALSFYREEKA